MVWLITRRRLVFLFIIMFGCSVCEVVCSACLLWFTPMFSALFSGWNISHISPSRLTFKWLNLELCVCACVCVFVDRKQVGVRVNAAEKREQRINTSLCLWVLQPQPRVHTKRTLSRWCQRNSERVRIIYGCVSACRQNLTAIRDKRFASKAKISHWTGLLTQGISIAAKPQT